MYNQRLFMQDGLVQKCKTGQANRLSWDSVMDKKVLRLSFCLKGKSGDEIDKLEIANLSKDQEYRAFADCDYKFKDILIPFDQIGHQEEISVV